MTIFLRYWQDTNVKGTTTYVAYTVDLKGQEFFTPETVFLPEEFVEFLYTEPNTRKQNVASFRQGYPNPLWLPPRPSKLHQRLAHLERKRRRK